MDLKELNKTLRADARAKGLCDEWYGEWKEENDSLQQLIDKYIKGFDFCAENRYPSNEFIKENFPQELLRKNNILVDDTYSLLNPKYAVILGSSKTTIRCNGYTVSTVYVFDSADVTLSAKSHAHVIVHVYGPDTRLSVIDESSNKVLVRKH